MIFSKLGINALRPKNLALGLLKSCDSQTLTLAQNLYQRDQIPIEFFPVCPSPYHKKPTMLTKSL